MTWNSINPEADILMERSQEIPHALTPAACPKFWLFPQFSPSLSEPSGNSATSRADQGRFLQKSTQASSSQLAQKWTKRVERS